MYEPGKQRKRKLEYTKEAVGVATSKRNSKSETNKNADASNVSVQAPADVAPPASSLPNTLIEVSQQQPLLVSDQIAHNASPVSHGSPQAQVHLHQPLPQQPPLIAQSSPISSTSASPNPLQISKLFNLPLACSTPQPSLPPQRRKHRLGLNGPCKSSTEANVSGSDSLSAFSAEKEEIFDEEKIVEMEGMLVFTQFIFCIYDYRFRSLYN